MVTTNCQISQRLLETFLKIQNRRKELEAEARFIKKEEDKLQSKLEMMVKANVPVAPGNYTCGYKLGKRSPKWKDEFITRLGAAEAEAVIANTEPAKVFFVGSE